MRPYEVMIIFDVDLDEETIRSTVQTHRDQLTAAGAQNGDVDFWGRRRFAYELKRKWEGYYVVLQTRAEPAAMNEMSRALSLSDEVLRHKVLRIPEVTYGQLRPTAVRAES